jgi:UDP-N-acetylmuramoyl-L-alanyl-D-glutamate--2,6-diaminopimelate ligase
MEPLRLTDLLMESHTVSEPRAALEKIEISGLTADSRQVRDGYLFAALPGSRADGRAFIGDAKKQGAAAVLAPEGTVLEGVDAGLPLITAANPRRALALMAAAFYGAQPETIAAVTGTSGKTSTAIFTQQIWAHAGLKAASLGTLGLLPERDYGLKSLTTPDPVSLAACLKALADEGFDHLVMEASSHGLDQYRLDGVRVKSACFTNLSRDHLDYHASMEAYLAAKARLFSELLDAEGTAVLNADVPEYDELRALCEKRGVTVWSYGFAGEELRLTEIAAEPGGLKVSFDLFQEPHVVSLSLAGRFQAFNVVGSLGLAISSGVEPASAIASLSSLQGVPGRMEPVGETPAGGHVYVDYAHKPGALETVLTALREHTRAKLHVVFGAGGDRDAGKRPMMGEIAQRLADEVIITDDNPRSEDPAAIRAEIAAAAPDAENIGDRGEAIRRAVAALGPGDCLVIAGKGHESGQTIGGRVLPFDDREVARAAIDALSQGGAA